MTDCNSQMKLWCLKNNELIQLKSYKLTTNTKGRYGHNIGQCKYLKVVSELMLIINRKIKII